MGGIFLMTSKRAIKADDFTRLEVYSDPQISPDGKGYAFVSTVINEEKEYESQLYYQDLKTEAIKQWTFGKGKNSHPRFSPDGKQVVFQSDRSGIPQIWLLPLEGGEAKQITTFKNGAVKPEWSKDGKYMAFTERMEKNEAIHDQQELTKEERQKEQQEKNKLPRVINRLKYKSDAGGLLDDKKSQIILCDIAANSFTQLTTSNQDHAFQDISPDGTTMLFAANLNEDADFELTNDLYELDIATKKVTKLTNEKGAYDRARYSPSGDKIVCFGHELDYAGATLTEIYLFDAQTGERKIL